MLYESTVYIILFVYSIDEGFKMLYDTDIKFLVTHNI
ncbi:hypothetical protein SDC9_57325 [bioreactor metagenome]|uniref:Uncharacterized protein n=1 Tax=bioreactor metagenome TaxID=1076179 RepID=A0A644X4V2_9ZZZZ